MVPCQVEFLYFASLRKGTPVVAIGEKSLFRSNLGGGNFSLANSVAELGNYAEKD